MIEQNGQTMNVFGQWITFMPNFKQEFEIRRVLFGITSMLQCDRQFMPPLVQERLPSITQWIVKLTSTCYDKRMKNLEKNEEFIKNGFNDGDDDESGDDSSGMEDEATNKMMNKLRKFKDGKP